VRAFVLTAIAMVAFAANSLLCRWALRPPGGGGPTVDPATFTVVRIVSGALFLAAVVAVRKKKQTGSGSWLSALSLAVYAFGFSFAYLGLATGTGALILFGGVQATMIGYGLVRGRGLSAREWVGLMVALGGLAYLVSPGLERPPLWAAGLMGIASIGWGVYSLRGKGSGDPVGVTAGNFLRGCALVVPVGAAWVIARGSTIGAEGLVLAGVSGAVTSGAGYVVWYAAVRMLRPVSASVVQLSVPVLAAGGGLAVLGEPVTARFVLSSVLVLGGLALAMARKR